MVGSKTLNATFNLLGDGKLTILNLWKAEVNLKWESFIDRKIFMQQNFIKNKSSCT